MSQIHVIIVMFTVKNVQSVIRELIVFSVQITCIWYLLVNVIFNAMLISMQLDISAIVSI